MSVPETVTTDKCEGEKAASSADAASEGRSRHCRLPIADWCVDFADLPFEFQRKRPRPVKDMKGVI